MEPTGIIFAALDCDADCIEDWNRWYDLEHTPPNVLLDGIMLSNRYVSTPALHSARDCASGSPFAGGRATFLTIYTLTGDPSTAFSGMSTLRDDLIASGRMASRGSPRSRPPRPGSFPPMCRSWATWASSSANVAVGQMPRLIGPVA
jgi:hypothetical protein